ncbi:hypothetical protein C8Q74DRAFT_130594 [Fomes fomentarius]|nr:hypothetical protein C8Q74DRAFT_130594 [Fomes fomentarius]
MSPARPYSKSRQAIPSYVLTTNRGMFNYPPEARKILKTFYGQVSKQPDHDQLEHLRDQISRIPGCERYTVNRIRVYFTTKRLINIHNIHKAQNAAGQQRSSLTKSATRRTRLSKERRVHLAQAKTLAAQLHHAFSAPPPPSPPERPPRTFAELGSWLDKANDISLDFLDKITAGHYESFGLTTDLVPLSSLPARPLFPAFEAE